MGRMSEQDAIAMLSPELRARYEAQNGRGRKVPVSVATEKPEPRRGRMNKTEKRYADDVLEPQRISGDVTWWAFEPMRFRLACGAYYCPDFIVIFAGGQIQAVEVKGHLREAAGLRFRVAADQFPWMTWRMVKWDGGWVEMRRLGRAA